METSLNNKVRRRKQKIIIEKFNRFFQVINKNIKTSYSLNGAKKNVIYVWTEKGSHLQVKNQIYDLK